MCTIYGKTCVVTMVKEFKVRFAHFNAFVRQALKRMTLVIKNIFECSSKHDTLPDHLLIWKFNSICAIIAKNQILNVFVKLISNANFVTGRRQFIVKMAVTVQQ